MSVSIPAAPQQGEQAKQSMMEEEESWEPSLEGLGQSNSAA